MSNRFAYPNTVVPYTVQIYDGGDPVTGVLSNATVTLNGGSPITGTVSGMVISITIPNNQPIANNVVVVLQWTQVVAGVTSVQSGSYLIDIVAAPSGSSQSFVPANVGRQCQRLVEPADTTVEQINGGNLSIYVDIPYSLLRCVASNLPSSGPDLVSFNYVDPLGQPGVLTINASLWMSDNGYCFVSADNGTQFYIASIRADFWQTNAPTINARNVNAGTPALLPCLNASRYGYDTLLPNQFVPSLMIVDGAVLNSGTSSSPNII